jgi:hypothetical protein
MIISAGRWDFKSWIKSPDLCGLGFYSYYWTFSDPRFIVFKAGLSRVSPSKVNLELWQGQSQESDNSK